jgi:hypothetical protein
MPVQIYPIARDADDSFDKIGLGSGWRMEDDNIAPFRPIENEAVVIE